MEIYSPVSPTKSGPLVEIRVRLYLRCDYLRALFPRVSQNNISYKLGTLFELRMWIHAHISIPGALKQVNNR